MGDSIVIPSGRKLTIPSGLMAQIEATIAGLITPGTPAAFITLSMDYPSVAMLSATSAVVCWQENIGYGRACVLTISGDTVTPGTPVAFESASPYTVSVAALSSTSAIVCYADGGNSTYGTACVLSISGTTITPGTPVVFESAAAGDTCVAALSSTSAVVCYRDNGNSQYGTACVLSISGTTITPGTPAVFESAYISYAAVAALSSTSAVVCYRDGGNSGFGTACVLSISGATITPGAPTVFENAAASFISVTAIDSTRALVGYTDDGSSYYGTAIVLSVSGTTITPGTPVVFENATAIYTAVAMLTPTLAVVCYSDGGNTYHGTACVLSVSGTSITPGTPAVFEDSACALCSVAMLTSTSAVVCYVNDGDSYFGLACVLTVS